MAHSSRLGVVAAALMIMGCGGPSPDSPVVGQVSGSAEALRSASTSDRARTSPGVTPPVQREVQGQEHPEATAPLQTQALWIEQQSDEMAPMTYTLADLENEPDQAHELWMEQVIQEVMEFDTLW